MIDPQVFEQEIAILMDWYNRDFEPATLKRLHQRLSQHLSTEQFVRAAQTVFDSSRFFPTVEEFVSTIKGDAQTFALQEWEVCVLAASRNDREMLTGLSPQGQSALHLVGGLYKLGMASEEQLTWIKKEFVGVWKSSSADTLSLPASRASAPIQLDLVAREYVSYISQTAIAIVPELQEVAGQHEQLVM